MIGGSIFITAVLIAIAVAIRALRINGVRRRRAGFLAAAFWSCVLVSAAYLYLIQYNVIQRDLYRVLLLFVVLIYFSGIEGWRLSRLMHGAQRGVWPR